MKKQFFAASLFFLLIVFMPQVTHARSTDALIQRGIAKTLFSVFELPYWMVRDTAEHFPIGILTGTIRGAARAVFGTVSGAVDLAMGLAPYAKYAALAL